MLYYGIENLYVGIKDAIIKNDGNEITICKINNITEDKINYDAYFLIKHLTGNYKISEIIKNIINNFNIEYTQALKIVKSQIEILNKNGYEIIYDEKPFFSNLKLFGDGSFYIPRHVSIELTNKCNLFCSYCYNSSIFNNNEFLENPIDFLKELKDIGVSSIELTGGEPFLHPMIYEILEYCVKNFKIVGVITNGTLFEEGKLLFLRNYENISFQITIPGSNYTFGIKDYNVTDKDAKYIFERKMEFIKFLINNKFIHRIAHIIDRKEKIDDLENIYKFLNKLGTSHFATSIALPKGRALDCYYNDLKPNDINYFFEELQNLNKKYPEFNYDSIIYDENKRNIMRNCNAGSVSVTISPEKTIMPCVLFYDKDRFKQKYSGSLIDSLRKYKNKAFLFKNLKYPSDETCHEECRYLSFCKFCFSRTFEIINDKEIRQNCRWFNLLDDKLKKELIDIFFFTESK